MMDLEKIVVFTTSPAITSKFSEANLQQGRVRNDEVKFRLCVSLNGHSNIT